MGNNEATTPSKSEKPYSPVQLQEQPAVHPYPDWAAMQAYYGPGVMPPPYFGTSVVPGHAPHPYMWAPQVSTNAAEIKTEIDAGLILSWNKGRQWAQEEGVVIAR